MKSWLINLTKYFQIYDYDETLKAQLVVYQLQGKATLWWEEVKAVHAIDEQSITWEAFQKHFINKYMTK